MPLEGFTTLSSRDSKATGLTTTGSGLNLTMLDAVTWVTDSLKQGRAELSRCNFDDHNISVIALALRDNPTVTEVDLSNNEITDEGAQHLIEAVTGNPHIRKIDLDGNNISPEVLEILAQALQGESAHPAQDLAGQDADTLHDGGA